jgi:hypothetical protein
MMRPFRRLAVNEPDRPFVRLMDWRHTGRRADTRTPLDPLSFQEQFRLVQQDPACGCRSVRTRRREGSLGPAEKNG